MYIALDTHDDVSNTLEDENSMKTRQFTILAGDYYSGLYYKVLAKVCNTEMIKKLSEGVKTINEHKVTIYSKKQSHVNEVINSVKFIEFSLIGELTDYFEVTNWNDAIANFLLLKRLLKEKSEYEQSEIQLSFMQSIIRYLLMIKMRKETIVNKGLSTM